MVRSSIAFFRKPVFLILGWHLPRFHAPPFVKNYTLLNLGKPQSEAERREAELYICHFATIFISKFLNLRISKLTLPDELVFKIRF